MMRIFMHKGLFLDDERNPEDVTWVSYPDNIEWTVVRTRSAFQDACETGEYLYYSFDHDIQDFTTVKKGTPIAETAFGIVYQEEDETFEHTGFHCALDLKDYLELGLDNEVKMKGFFVHSKNPIGAKKIYNLLK
jgi:hypothetical protein